MRQIIVHGKIYSLTTPRPPRRGQEMAQHSIIDDGALVIEHGIILAVGPTKRILTDFGADAHLVDAGGCLVVPGFVDCHTHLPFAGWRADEYRQRLMGHTYQEMGKLGGIARSGRQLLESPDEDVMVFCERLMEEMLESGTTTIEMKSGYGLSLEGELRQLRLIQEFRHRLRQRITATGLFLHAVPENTTKEKWLWEVENELLPQAHQRQWLDAVDVFVETSAFSPDEAQGYLRKAREMNLNIRVHSDQFSHFGGTALALELGARGIDHLDHIGTPDIIQFQNSNSVAVLLPGATYSLNHKPYPPARNLIDRNIAVALASDFNPGTSPISSMPLIMSMAVHFFGLSPEEALSASTINPAYVLGLEHEVGSLEVGKRADVLILDTNTLETIPYRAGHNPVHRVFVHGNLMRH